MTKDEHIKSLRDEADESARRAHDWRVKHDAMEKRSTEVSMQFADLKRRLHNAELDIAKLEGYIARVQEDDVVREELITVGELGVEERQVPKRKHAHFTKAENIESPYTDMATASTGFVSESTHPRNRKHWIEY